MRNWFVNQIIAVVGLTRDFGKLDYGLAADGFGNYSNDRRGNGCSDIRLGLSPYRLAIGDGELCYWHP